VVARTIAESKGDHLSLLAAGVAFFALLSMVPGLVALVSVYGLAADPSDVGRHVTDALGAAPSEVQDLVREQLEAVTERSGASIGVGLVAGLAVALWSASSAMKHLIEALNAAYDEIEGRTFLKVRALALVLTIGAVAFVLGAIAVIAVVPAVVDGPLTLLRWPMLAAAFVVALAVLYRYGPSRDDPEWRWTTPGALLATVLWLAASGGFAFYAGRFGSYDETYGSLGGIVVVMLWLFLSAVAVLLGAELDAELERQTTYDTTEGDDRPKGQRGAHAADTLGPTADEVRGDAKAAKSAANR
jgi:membrane protein